MNYSLISVLDSEWLALSILLDGNVSAEKAEQSAVVAEDGKSVSEMTTPMSPVPNGGDHVKPHNIGELDSSRYNESYAVYTKQNLW